MVVAVLAVQVVALVALPHVAITGVVNQQGQSKK